MRDVTITLGTAAFMSEKIALPVADSNMTLARAITDCQGRMGDVLPDDRQEIPDTADYQLTAPEEEDLISFNTPWNHVLSSSDCILCALCDYCYRRSC